MREIKFRGKRTDNDKWIYGYLLYDYDCEDNYVPFITWKTDTYVGGCGEEQILENTIGQYTGLHDKSGKEIYEGDIVKYDAYLKDDFDFPAGKGQILWDDEDTGFYLTSKTSYFINLFDLTRNLNAEVIGNIYDNPELLEEK